MNLQGDDRFVFSPMTAGCAGFEVCRWEKRAWRFEPLAEAEKKDLDECALAGCVFVCLWGGGACPARNHV